MLLVVVLLLEELEPLLLGHQHLLLGVNLSLLSLRHLLQLCGRKVAEVWGAVGVALRRRRCVCVALHLFAAAAGRD